MCHIKPTSIFVPIERVAFKLRQFMKGCTDTSQRLMKAEYIKKDSDIRGLPHKITDIEETGRTSTFADAA